MSKKAKTKFTPTANPEYAKAMRELRRSGAAGPHVPGPRRGARGARRRAAVASSRWG